MLGAASRRLPQTGASLFRDMESLSLYPARLGSLAGDIHSCRRESSVFGSVVLNPIMPNIPSPSGIVRFASLSPSIWTPEKLIRTSPAQSILFVSMTGTSPSLKIERVASTMAFLHYSTSFPLSLLREDSPNNGRAIANSTSERSARCRGRPSNFEDV